MLASQSPRRKEILTQAGIPFLARPVDIDETRRPDEPPVDYACRVARSKAEAAEARPDDVVLAADTSVVIYGEVFGKPADAAGAARMLRALAGREHSVVTGICVKSNSTFHEDAVTTRVWFAPMSEREIADYVASGEPMDKAGAYAIQGLASKFVERIEGCYFNVVGLPIAKVYAMLRSIGAPFP